MTVMMTKMVLSNLAKRILKIFWPVVETEIGSVFLVSTSALHFMSFTNICVLESKFSASKSPS